MNSRAGGLPALWVDDECAVKTLVDMPLERCGMAVIEVTAKRLGVKLVDELLARQDFARAHASDAIHFGGMNTVKMHCVGMAAAVEEVDPQVVAFRAANGWAGDTTVVSPGRKANPWCDLDLLVYRDDVILTQPLPAGQGAYPAIIPVHQ